MKDCTYELVYNGISEVFNREEALDAYILQNQETFDLEHADDFRYSKDLLQENIDKLEGIGDLNKKALSKIKKANEDISEDGEETFEKYTDGYVSVLEFINEAGLTKKREQYNEADYIRNLTSKLRKDYADLSDAERNSKIEESVKDKLKSNEQLKALGKGIHRIAEDVFYNPFLTFDTYPEAFRAKINAKGNPERFGLEFLTDDTIQTITKELYKLKKSIAGHKAIKKVFIEPCIDFTSDLYKIRGKIDTVVMYDDGSIDIIDFKVSTHNEDSWDQNKKETARMQLRTYEVMLQNHGIYSDKVNLRIIPIQVKKNGDIFDFVQFGNPKPLDPDPIERNKILDNLNINVAAKPLTSDLAKDTVGVLSKMIGFDAFNTEMEEKNIEKAMELVRKNKKGEYYFSTITYNPLKSKISSEMLTGETKDIVREKIIRHYRDINESRAQFTDRIIESFNNWDRKKSQNVEFLREDKKGINGWLNTLLTKYKLSNSWKIVDNKALSELGVIMFKNDVTQEFDLISISFDSLLNQLQLEYGNSILGHYYENNKTDSVKERLLATIGNIELVKLMYLSNQFNIGYTSGELKVLSLSERTWMSDTDIRNKLEHNYNILANKVQIPVNRIKATDLINTVAASYNAIMNSSTYNNVFDALDIKKKDYKDDLFKSLDKLQRYKDLKKLRDLMVSNIYKNKVDSTTDNSVVGYLFYQVSQALAKLGGVDVDYNNVSKFSDNILGGKLSKAFKDQSLFNSTLLNTQDTIPIVANIYDRITEANSRARTEYVGYKVIDRRHTDLLKNSNKGLRTSKFINNTEVIYRNLFDRSFENDLVLKDYRYDTSLNSDEKAYLEWYLSDLNNRRYGTNDIENIEEVYGADSWRQVPLMRAGMLSRVINNKQGVVEAFKEEHGLEDSIVEPRMSYGMEAAKTDFGKNGLIFDSMYDSFEVSKDQSTRTSMINQRGIDSFETNLERIKDAYAYLQIRKTHLDPVIADVSSALCAYSWAVKLQSGQESANKPTIDYIVDFIKSSVLDMSLIKEEDKDLFRVIGTMKSVASKIVLGANVLSMLKEGTVGWWTLFEHAMANTVDPTRFGIKEATKAYGLVWGDAARQMKSITIGEHLNAQYGIANMSEQELAERMNYYQGQIGRINNLMFFTARAPDFLHRMTVFTAYMLKDGCYDAHHLVDDHIEYNWKEDKRFEVYARYMNTPEANIPKSEYNTFVDQRALYEAVKQQMIAEKANYIDWKTGEAKTFTEADVDLPKAYTNLEANKMIQESNSMFGYMDTNNKAMYLRKSWGIVLGQFQAYFSAKKNLFFLKPDTYKTGRWVDKTDAEGNKLYKKILDNGEVIETTENTGIPIKHWEGGMMEGIFWSLISCFNFKNMFTEAGRAELKKAWRDPVKHRNLILLAGEIGGWALFSAICYMLWGGASKSDMDYFDQNMSRILQNAAREFNPVDVFTGQLDLGFTAWNVNFKFAGALYDCVMGNNNLPRAMVSNVGALRPFKPMVYDLFPLNEE